MGYSVQDILVEWSPVMVSVFYGLRTLVKGSAKEKGLLYGMLRAILACNVSWVLLAFLIGLLDIFVFRGISNPEMHSCNISGILFVLMAFQICRFWLEQNEALGQGQAPAANIALDFVHNGVLFTLAYLSTQNSAPMLSLAGKLTAGITVALQLKFRIVDDILKHRIYEPKARRYTSADGRDPGHIVLRGLLDHIPRSWLYTAFSFTVIFLQMTRVSPGDFVMSHQTANSFVDMFYFNIVTMATVGYGDVVPHSPSAKLLCVLEIFISIFILSAVLQLVWGRFQKAAEGGTVEK